MSSVSGSIINSPSTDPAMKDNCYFQNWTVSWVIHFEVFEIFEHLICLPVTLLARTSCCKISVSSLALVAPFAGSIWILKLTDMPPSSGSLSENERKWIKISYIDDQYIMKWSFTTLTNNTYPSNKNTSLCTYLDASGLPLNTKSNLCW